MPVLLNTLPSVLRRQRKLPLLQQMLPSKQPPKQLPMVPKAMT